MAMTARRVLSAMVGIISILSFSHSEPASAAACAGPIIEVRPASGGAGSLVGVSGTGFMAECRDTWTCEEGGECVPPEPSPPAESVEVFFEQHGTSRMIATAHPDATYAFVVEVTIPPDASVGAATLSAAAVNGTRTAPVPFTVTAPTTAPGPDPSPGVRTSLPRTGSASPTDLAATGLVALLAGALLTRCPSGRMPR